MQAEHEVAFGPGQRVVHIRRDLRLTARHVPDSKFVQHPLVRKSRWYAAQVQIEVGANQGPHAILDGFQVAIAIDGHVIAALTGDESEVLPAVDDLRRRQISEPTAQGNVSKVPIHHSVCKRNVRVENAVRCILAGREWTLAERGLCQRAVDLLPEFNRYFGGGCRVDKILELNVSVIEIQRVARPGLTGGPGMARSKKEEKNKTPQNPRPASGAACGDQKGFSLESHTAT